MSHSLHMQSSAEDWTKVTDPKLRRKLQNRLNVRAHRQRSNKSNEQNTIQYSPVYFGVLKPLYPPSLATAGQSSSTKHGQISTSRPQDKLRGYGTSVCKYFRESTPSGRFLHEITGPDFRLSSDHLVPLVQYNVVRASLTNAAIMSMLHLVRRDECMVLQQPNIPLFPTSSLSIPVDRISQLPPNLRPTELQLAISHDFWIDLIPDPRLRDNLLRALDKRTFNVLEFQSDVVGQVCQDRFERLSALASDNMQSACSSVVSKGVGVLVWSDPWCTSSLEITEHFWKKWKTVLEGCTNLLESTNYWRALRGEESLEIDD